MKPVQIHRILKERIILETHDTKVGGLVPLVNNGVKDFHLRGPDRPLSLVKHPDSHLIPQKNQNSNPLLPRIENNNGGEAGKRIKELEKENFKLNHHVQQAEQTIRNYRSLLLKYNINPSEPVSTTVINQSQPQSSSPPQAPIETNEQQEALAALHLDLSTLRSQVAKLQAENSSLSQSILDYKNKQGSQQELINRNESLQQTLRVRERRVHEMEQEVSSYKSEIQKHQSRIKTLGSHMAELYSELQGLKVKQLEMKESAQHSVVQVQHHLQAQLTLLLHRLKRPIPSPKKPSPVKMDRSSLYEEEIERLKAELAEARWTVASLTSQVQHQEAQQQSQIHNSLQSFQEARDQVEKLEQRFGELGNAVHDLHCIHGAEIKAVRHLAHIKELKRIAREREETLERDRLQIEIKFLKDIQSLLIFSLNTAEHSLHDLLPHVVVKLSESRQKRSKQVELLYKSKLKDVEQRSAETCAVSSSQLELFYNKAVENEKQAEEMTKIAKEKINSALQPDRPIS